MLIGADWSRESMGFYHVMVIHHNPGNWVRVSPMLLVHQSVPDLFTEMI